jgi:hypothetical protein
MGIRKALASQALLQGRKLFDEEIKKFGGFLR